MVRDLPVIRGEIDRTDDEILRLLNQRARLVAEVATLKEQLQVPFYVPSRERQIAERLSAANAGLGPFPTEAIRSVFQEIFSACLSLEKTVRVAYLGPEGTFSHMAVKRQFGMSARATPIGTIPGVFEEVERGNADIGVVPIENTTEGVVNHTLDSFMESDLKISAEIALEVTMCLLARAGTELGADRARLLDPDRRRAGAPLAGDQPAARHAGRDRARRPRGRARRSTTRTAPRSRRRWRPSCTTYRSCGATSRTCRTT